MYIKGMNQFSNSEIKIAPKWFIHLRSRRNMDRILSKEHGWALSNHNWNSIDADGFPLPWFTYPAIHYLVNLNFSGNRVLEWGGGNSSTWWSKRCMSLTVIESNVHWFEAIEKNLEKASNVRMKLAENRDDYVASDQIALHDVFVIDGEYRSEIMGEIVRHFISTNLTPALVILDNSDRLTEEAHNFAQALRMHEVTFRGFGPINDYEWETTVFINPNYFFRQK
jgi:hypothetical protein